jgi:hypothetical protein
VISKLDPRYNSDILLRYVAGTSWTMNAASLSKREMSSFHRQITPTQVWNSLKLKTDLQSWQATFNTKIGGDRGGIKQLANETEFANSSNH